MGLGTEWHVVREAYRRITRVYERANMLATLGNVDRWAEVAKRKRREITAAVAAFIKEACRVGDGAFRLEGPRRLPPHERLGSGGGYARRGICPLSTPARRGGLASPGSARLRGLGLRPVKGHAPSSSARVGVWVGLSGPGPDGGRLCRTCPSGRRGRLSMRGDALHYLMIYCAFIVGVLV